MKQIDVTIRTVEYNTYRVEVDDDFDANSFDELDTLEDIEESPLVLSSIKEWAITQAEISA